MYTTQDQERQIFWANLPLPEMAPVTVGVTAKDVWMKSPTGQSFGPYLNVFKEDVTPISVCVVKDVEYITTTQFRTYVRAPMMNLYTGKWGVCWLEQCPTEPNRFTVDRVLLPTPDIMGVFQDTLPKTSYRRDKDHSPVEGYLSPGNTCGIAKDRKGRYWQTCSDSVNAFTFRVPNTNRNFVLHPPISELEYRGDEMWFVEHNNRHKTESRITACTYEVRLVIEESGLWDYYNPKGKAQTDPEIARQELENLDNTSPLLMGDRQKFQELQTLKIKNEKMNSEFQDLKDDLALTKQSLKEKEKEIERLCEENDRLQQVSQSTRSLKDYDNFSPIFK